MVDTALPASQAKKEGPDMKKTRLSPGGKSLVLICAITAVPGPRKGRIVEHRTTFQ